jgi:hypothetical protein
MLFDSFPGHHVFSHLQVPKPSVSFHFVPISCAPEFAHGVKLRASDFTPGSRQAARPFLLDLTVNRSAACRARVKQSVAQCVGLQASGYCSMPLGSIRSSKKWQASLSAKMTTCTMLLGRAYCASAVGDFPIATSGG